jgi:hypothetical protein
MPIFIKIDEQIIETYIKDEIVIVPMKTIDIFCICFNDFLTDFDENWQLNISSVCGGVEITSSLW